MASGLVDLSLFAYSPTTDNQFSNISRVEDFRLYSSATWPPRSTSPGPTETQQTTTAVKQAPRRPRRNIYDLCIPPTAGSKCVLRRIKRVKLDTLCGEHRCRLRSAPSAYASAPSAYINPNSTPAPPAQPAQQVRPVQTTQPEPRTPNQTIQERRHPQDPQLTLPSNHAPTTGNGLQMVWLADEQMWLVADPTDPSYGYYATGPEEGTEWLPPYVENDDSPVSEPSQSDFSPIREQFASLMGSQQREGRPPTINPDEPQMSPLFHEALAGITMLNVTDFSDYQVPTTRKEAYPTNTRRTTQSTQHEQQSAYTPYNRTNNPWNARVSRDEFRPPVPSMPRSESPALRTSEMHNGKYSTEAEIQRQNQRLARRRLAVERQMQQGAPPRDGYIPYGHGSNYRPSALSRRDSWHSDSASTTGSFLSSEIVWPVRSSSARH